MIFSISSCFLIVSCLGHAQAFQVPTGIAKASTVRDNSQVILSAARRDIFSSITGGMCSLLLVPTSSAVADGEGDLASQMFNPDGSLKEGVESEAKQRLVEFGWEVSETLNLHEDGVNLGDTRSGSQVRLTYEFPQKWSDGKNGDEIYFDRSEGTNAKACKRITIFQAPGLADIKQLEKATTIGVAKAFNVPDDLKRLYKADLVSGRKANRNDQVYYEFDMAAAPDTCGDSGENLGLGFCPYDNIFLLSATIVKDRLYCMVVECDSTRVWKLASSELKRARSSFSVTEA